MQSQVFQGQTSLGEVYDVICGGQVEARMPDRQDAVSLAAAGVAVEALPRVQHADGFVRYQVKTKGVLWRGACVTCVWCQPCLESQPDANCLSL